VLARKVRAIARKEEMKLFTIGDSVSQGYMSLAAARTDLSYSTLIAGAMGLKLGEDYAYPRWAAGGLPLNLEVVLRRLNERYGNDLSIFETLGVLRTIYEFTSETKSYYETGTGGATVKAPEGVEYFHNVSIQGFDVADSWLVTPSLCKREIDLAQSAPGSGVVLAGPSAAFYRTALKVLNPSLSEEYDEFTQLDWLRHHADAPAGVENLVLWLGANNALGTVVALDIRQTPGDHINRPEDMDHITRDKVRRWNLWHPDDFKREYGKLLDQVDGIMRVNRNQGWNVFVGTVPLVTISPLAKGVGPGTEIDVIRPVVSADGSQQDIPDKSIYYKYYVWFPFEEDAVRAGSTIPYLTIQDAIHIDECIRQYNRTIAELLRNLNRSHANADGTQRYHVVDVADAMQRLAWKRNSGNPTYRFPAYFDFVYPKVNTKYYYVDARGNLAQGGLFSLDGVHPSPIAHGLIAHEFMKVMKEAGVAFDEELRWPEIFANDLLYSEPIALTQWLYEHEELAERILSVIQVFRRRD
jgi:hypothetical protein